MNKTLTTLAAVAALAITGCGGSSGSATSHNAQVLGAAKQAAVTEQSIERLFLRTAPHAQYEVGGNQVEYLAPGEDRSDLQINAACSILILVTPQAIASYRDDPHTVFNPAGTVGVQVDAATDPLQVSCMQIAAKTLKEVK